MRETGLVVNPVLFWLGWSPDCLVFDGRIPLPFGCLEIKCPENMKNLTPTQAMKDPSFYVEMRDRKPALKKNYSLGYTAKYSSRWGSHNLLGSILLFISSKASSSHGYSLMKSTSDHRYLNQLTSISSTSFIVWSINEMPKTQVLNHHRNNLPRLASNFVSNSFLKATKCTNWHCQKPALYK